MKKFFGYFVILYMVMLTGSCHSSKVTTTSSVSTPSITQLVSVAPLAKPLSASLWNQSQWISAANAPVVTGKIDDSKNSRAADGASWFVSSMKNEKAVVSAQWMTTALGVYDLFVNGERVGDEVLKPGFTHVKKTRRSFTYNVTSLFKCGANAENQLAVQVTPGWWADKIVTPSGSEGMLGKKCAFRGVLQLTYADGTTQVFGTDLTHWRAGIAGPVRHAAIFDGEEYDARIEAGYKTPELLSTPEENTEFAGEMLPSDGAEIYLREDIALRPREA